MNTVQARGALVGAWRLVSWENQAADGQVSYPMGTDALGYLLYTADGRFSVMISRAGRPGFAAADLLGGTMQEQGRAVEGFVAYGGRYSFSADRVVHHVELSLFPNWVGSDQERTVELDEDRLVLSANPLLLGGSGRCPAWSGSGLREVRTANRLGRSLVLTIEVVHSRPNCPAEHGRAGHHRASRPSSTAQRSLPARRTFTRRP